MRKFKVPEKYTCENCRCKKQEEIDRIELIREIVMICKNGIGQDVDCLGDKLDSCLDKLTKNTSAQGIQKILRDIESGNYDAFWCQDINCIFYDMAAAEGSKLKQ